MKRKSNHKKTVPFYSRVVLAETTLRVLAKPIRGYLSKTRRNCWKQEARRNSLDSIHTAVPFTATPAPRWQEAAMGEIFLFPSMILSSCNCIDSYPGLFRSVESGKLEIPNTAFLGITSWLLHSSLENVEMKRFMIKKWLLLSLMIPEAGSDFEDDIISFLFLILLQ